MATGSIASPGLGSNLDVSGIVSKLMALEARPLNILNAREGRLQAQISLFGQIKGTIASMQSAARSLGTSVAAAAYRASSTNETVVAVRAESGVTVGSHDVTIANIAQAQRIATAGQASRTAAIGSGAATTLTISFGTISGGTLVPDTGLYSGAAFNANGARTPVVIDIDGTNNTLEGLRTAINAANAGVTASIVSDGTATPNRLVISSISTGLENSVKIEVTGDAALQNLLAYDASGTQNLSQLQSARSAALSIDGVSITSAGNSVSGAIEGLTFDLKAAGSAIVSVNRNTTQIEAALNQLVKSYNDANKAIVDNTKKDAVLQGDTGTVSLLARLRAEIGAHRAGAGTYSSLSQVGVSFARDGSLTLDSARLSSTLLAGTDEVSSLLGRVATALSATTDGMLGSNGSLQAHTDSANRSIKEVDRRRESLNGRLEQVQARYLAQFTALDTMISGMKQTSAFLDQQIANLPKING